MRDITFIIAEVSESYNSKVEIITYDKDFRWLNREVEQKDLFKEMQKISSKCNNSSMGCFGCLFCTD